VIFFRAAILAVVIGLAVLAITRSTTVSQLSQPASVATPVPTRVPLPTLAPEAIISRISRETPAPPPRVTPSAQPRVEVVDYGYSPQQVTVHLGASITWTNDGNDGHDVTGSGPGGEWRSGPLAPSERYTREFNLTGTFDYVCTIHPEMRGRVIVQS
jgi:plastocyanin